MSILEVVGLVVLEAFEFNCGMILFLTVIITLVPIIGRLIFYYKHFKFYDLSVPNSFCWGNEYAVQMRT